MIRIYADLHKDKNLFYIEDVISSFDLCNMKKEEFKKFIRSFIRYHGDIHTCYDGFVNKVGRFINDYGKRWYGEEFVVYTTYLSRFGRETKRKVKHKYDSKGYLTNWTIGYFG